MSWSGMALDGLGALMTLLIIFGFIFVVAGSLSGFNIGDPNLSFGLTLILAAGGIMFLRVFIQKHF